MNEQQLIERLEMLPDRAQRPDWDDVLDRAAVVSHPEASRRRVQRRRFVFSPRRVLLFAALAGAVVVAAVTLPGWFGRGERLSLVDRALAAVSQGPVLRVTLRGEWGGTLVDLTNGTRTPVYGEDEVWFDTETGETRTISRLGGVVQSDELGKPKKPEAKLAALGYEYRQALESGTARVAGDDTIDGQLVVWLTIHSELLPDVADGKDHEWTQQVAVSKQTFKPIALRETRDGQPGPDTLQRVIDLEMLPRDQADFTTSRPSLEGTAFKQSREKIVPGDAASVLGRVPLWLGKSYDGLPLGQLYRETTSAGHQQRVRLEGAKAAAAIRCSNQPASAGDCFGALGLSSVEVRPDGVYTTVGPIQWSDKQTSLVLSYGTDGDVPRTSRYDSSSPTDKPYVMITETTQASPFRRGVGTYMPPQGSVFVTADGRLGYLQEDGIQISIEAPSEAAVIAAARSLSPVPNA